MNAVQNAGVWDLKIEYCNRFHSRSHFGLHKSVPRFMTSISSLHICETVKVKTLELVLFGFFGNETLDKSSFSKSCVSSAESPGIKVTFDCGRENTKSNKFNLPSASPNGIISLDFVPHSNVTFSPATDDSSNSKCKTKTGEYLSKKRNTNVEIT